MRSADLACMARQRAGLTQAELAARSGFSRESIARWESGAREPSLASLSELVSASGLDLSISIAEGDHSLDGLVHDQWDLSPMRRLAKLMPEEQLEEALDALRWLAGAARSETVVVGGIAAALQGGPQRPAGGGVEVVAADPGALVDELAEASFSPLDSPERWAQSDRRWPWAHPSQGMVVLASGLPGSGDFKDLRRGARTLELERGWAARVANPRDLLRLAEASSRAEERARLPGLRALLRGWADPSRT